MKKDKVFREFLKRVGRGRKFEEWERSQWNDRINSAAKFEAPTQWDGKHGRVDDDRAGTRSLAGLRSDED